MQAAIDRQTKRGARVPLDVLVELSHDDHAEPFEADGVNVGRGGLTLRAAYLPEVGSRLACRFECPPDGAPIEAACEVVWVEGVGEHAGEFGVRFLEASAGADDRIRAFVRAMAGDADVAERDVARLYLDGVATPIVARVSHRSEDIVTVEQDLPFLALGKGLALRDGDRARRAQIASIDLQLAGDVPRLVLQVLYDDEVAEDAEDVEDAAEPALPFAAVSERTDPDLVAPVYSRYAIEPEAPAAEALDTPVPSAPRRKERESVQVVRTQVDPDELARESASESARGEGLKEATRPSFPPIGAGLLAVWAAMAIARVAPMVARGRSLAWPVLRRGWEQLVAWTRLIARDAGPRLRAAVAATRRVAAPLLASAVLMVQKRTSRTAPPVRRTTAPPPASLDVRGLRPTTGRVALSREEVVPAAAMPRRKLGRPIAIGVAALALGVLFAWVITSGDDDDGVPLPHAVTATPAPAAAAAVAAAPAAAPTPAAQEMGLVGAGLPTAPVTVQSPTDLPPAAALVAPAPPVADPPMPTALGAPSYVAGHLPPPTYPTLDGAPRPVSAPATVPIGSPYAIDARVHAGRPVPPGAQAYREEHAVGARPLAAAPVAVARPGAGGVVRAVGAASVAHARSFTLHLTREPQGLEGGNTPDGFGVRVRGALSLDRAGPLAASHPAIERAIVMNRGDHADLQIVFKNGMHPAYRVAARGATIEISIAPR